MTSQVPDKVLLGHYGAFADNKRLLYQAIAVGRIIIHRGFGPPSNFRGLLEKAEKWGIEGYDRRRQLLNHFGIRDYRQYLKTELWQAIRSLALAGDRGRCKMCHATATQVHHMSYDIGTLSGASIAELASVCRDCHEGVEFDYYGRKRPFTEVVKRTKYRIKNPRAW